MSSTANLHSLGIGLASTNSAGEVIEVFYPRPLLAPGTNLSAGICSALSCPPTDQVLKLSAAQCQNLIGYLDTVLPEHSAEISAMNQSGKQLILTMIAEDKAPGTVAEVYLKLHLLSHRLSKPQTLNLQGAFAILPTLAWTNEGAIAMQELSARQLAARAAGRTLQVNSVDKFPRMSDYVIPAGVRIADTARVRLGAYIGEGTTVMHEGFVNFNAGTLGTAMIEGRISAGVIVGDGSDLGGGCSTMGTLSGGGTEIISVGENCLIGANAGLGFPLGDRCIIEAGLYVTAGTKVLLLDRDDKPISILKARALAGKPDLLFRRNSQTGAVECKTNQTSMALNTELHNNN
ncbi:MAG: tetrahydrodipicolinate N-succinyltransferase N-terminal domain-containing protein [Pseudomonadales bacterium]|nr:tetrahydrodipicolinate N-succinyltransferase N-terminal domain-containing protein [Pseudomonadales bacterium]